jgi:hypothetical protein
MVDAAERPGSYLNLGHQAAGDLDGLAELFQ